MPNWLRQNTATQVWLGPLVQASDGYSYMATTITLAAGAVKYVHTAAAAGVVGSVGGVSLPVAGWAAVPLAASDVATAGPLSIWVGSATNNLPAWREFLVVPAQVYDSMILGTDLLQIDVQQVSNVAVGQNTALIGTNVITFNGAAPTAVVLEANARLIGGATPTTITFNADTKLIGGLAPTNVVLEANARLIAGTTPTNLVLETNARLLGGATPTNVVFGVNLIQIGGAAPSTAFPPLLLDYVMFTPGAQTITLKDTVRVIASVLGGKEDGATGANMRFFDVSGTLCRVSAQVVSGKRTGVTWVTGPS